jgi:glycosyltransferase involved in cell wall biosynthesis
MVNMNNRHALQLTIESFRKRTRYSNYELWVVDNCSTDGAREYLESLQGTFPMRLILAEKPRSHSEWLDWAFENIQTPLWVGMDNDIYFLGADWLADLVRRMVQDPDLYLLGGEHLMPMLNYVEPVGNELINVGERFSAYLFCVRTSLRDQLRTSFAFYKMPREEGKLLTCLDTGGKLMADMAERKLTFAFMPRWFRWKWHHIGNLTWVFNHTVNDQVRDLKLYQLRDIQSRVESGRI